MIEPPLGPPPSRPAAAPRPVANPGGSLLRRYGPAPTEPPRTLPEVFAWLQSKRR
jgi:hypothetical protein